MAFHLFHTKEGGIMSDYEIISIVIMLFMLVFAAMAYGKKDK